VDRFRAMTGPDDSPYPEEVHFYLARAFLRRKDFGATETELKKLTQLLGTGSVQTTADRGGAA
jgi:hypothetical protein